MSYTPYDQCARSVYRALEILGGLRRRERVAADKPGDIHRRRRTADIALQATFDDLRRAFLTPIDREDVLYLRQVCERVATTAEDVVLALYQAGEHALCADDTALLSAVTAECEALHEALIALPAYPRNDGILRHLTAAERRHLAVVELGGTASLLRLSDACRMATEALRRILLCIT